MLTLLQKLAELEKEEEIREESGMYVIPKIEYDETMLEIKRLAKQIREKKAILKDEARVNKQSKRPAMPRTTTPKVSSIKTLNQCNVLLCVS